MHVRSILNVLAALTTLLGLTMLFAAIWSFLYNESDLKGILLSSAITLSISLPSFFFTRGKINLSIKDKESFEEKEALTQYGSSDSGASLGDILGKVLNKKK